MKDLTKQPNKCNNRTMISVRLVALRRPAFATRHLFVPEIKFL
jgi:hypothetical protein